MKHSLLVYAVLLVGVLAYFANGDDVDVAKETAAPAKKPVLVGSGTVADRQRLAHELFTNYKKTVNPDHPDVRFGVALIDFHVCNKKQLLNSYLWLRYVWQDDRLRWDEKDFGGVGVIRYDSKEVWKPDITLYNSADPVHQMSCWDSNVLIYPNGEVLWVPPCKLVSHCDYTLDREPYGEQTCSLKFGSWTFDGLVMDLSFYKNITTFDLTDMDNSSGFEVLSTTGEKHTKYYSCCAEPYQDLTFNMTIKRIPGEELLRRL
jgi:nicotinic acetylcholine receptor